VQPFGDAHRPLNVRVSHNALRGLALPPRRFFTQLLKIIFEGADALCASQAAAAGLKGDFAAWLSTSTTAVAERVLHSSCNYTLVDSTWVAYDWEDLTDGDIWVPINLDANGVIQDGDVWTGTEPDGSSYEGGDCSGFTSASSELVSLAGSTESNDASWTAEQTQACSTPLRLYCVQTLR